MAEESMEDLRDVSVELARGTSDLAENIGGGAADSVISALSEVDKLL